MAYVPRSPRRTTQLRAVLGDGQQHLRVRDMSTSGLFLEAPTTGAAQLQRGATVAVVPLCGELDGERLPAEVVRVGPQGVALRFIGLDADRRARLRGLFSLVHPESPRGTRRPAQPRGRPLPLPANATVVLLTDDTEAQPALPLPDAPARADIEELVADAVAELEDQLVELGLRNARLSDEKAQLALRLHALEAKLAVRQLLEQDLFEAWETIEELEATNDHLLTLLSDGRQPR